MKTLSLKWRLTLMTSALIVLVSVVLNLLVSSSGLSSLDSLETYILQFSDADMPVPPDDFEVELTDSQRALLEDQLSQKVDAAKRGYSLYGWLITAAVALAGGVITWFLSGRSLRPLRAFSRRVESVQAQNLSDVRLSEDVLPEFRQLSRAFNAMLERLSHSFLSQRRFTASAAHELRTPLALMQAQLDLYDRNHASSAPDDTAETFAMVREQTAKLSMLVKTLLEMSEMRTLPRNEKVALAPLAEEVLTDLAPVAEGKGVRLSQSGGDAWLLGSDLMLYRMVFNLVENAIKYNREGGAVEVSIGSAPEGIHLRVADSGPGIPGDALERVFEPFFRADKARSRAMGGVGLGLTLAREIAKLHGGRLSIEKSGSSGTTFLCSLPRQAD